MHRAFLAEPTTDTVPVRLYRSEDWEKASDRLDARIVRFAAVNRFKAGAGQMLMLPGEDGELSEVLFGLGDNSDPRTLVMLGAKLPEGDFAIVEGVDLVGAESAALLFAEGAYRFSRYTEAEPSGRLVVPGDAVAMEVSRQAAAADLLRDLVNTPAEDMGPEGLEAAVRDMAGHHEAEVRVTMGDALLAENYPLIHAVGRAGPQAPRLIELEWGHPDHPRLAIVGKGVCYDTGGLNLKPGNYMRDMKKDMGGAAHAIALAGLVMEARMPVRLHLLVPAVENSVSSVSFRPGDVFRSRKGITVEIDNTDAEGRLVLADALTRASEETPELMLDFATLTGAARVALGADLAPFYTDDNDLAAAFDIAAWRVADPVWRMPLWSPYLSELKSSVADIANAGGTLAGSITAALFLRKFVGETRWVHFDVWAWRTAAYGRPAGAAACGLRASWGMLKDRFGVES
jgi:leucyl aminopeptidase